MRKAGFDNLTKNVLMARETEGNCNIPHMLVYGRTGIRKEK